jgi:hypothetical protein
MGAAVRTTSNCCSLKASIAQPLKERVPALRRRTESGLLPHRAPKRCGPKPSPCPRRGMPLRERAYPWRARTVPAVVSMPGDTQRACRRLGLSQVKTPGESTPAVPRTACLS